MHQRSLPIAPWLWWPAWVAINSIAVFVGYILAGTAPSIGQLAQVQVTDRMITTVMALTIGIALALSQWLLVRLHIPRARLWLLATFLGWIAPIALFLAMPPASQGPQIASLFALLGVTMGALQYLVIRPHHSHSWWWVPRVASSSHLSSRSDSQRPGLFRHWRHSSPRYRDDLCLDHRSQGSDEGSLLNNDEPYRDIGNRIFSRHR